MMHRLIHGMSLILPVVGVFLVITQLFISNYLVSAGKSTLLLDQEIAEIRTQNEILRQEVGQETSLSRIEARALEIGLVKSNHIFTLTPPNVAYNKSL